MVCSYDGGGSGVDCSFLVAAELDSGITSLKNESTDSYLGGALGGSKLLSLELACRVDVPFKMVFYRTLLYHNC